MVSSSVRYVEGESASFSLGWQGGACFAAPALFEEGRVTQQLLLHTSVGVFHPGITLVRKVGSFRAPLSQKCRSDRTEKMPKEVLVRASFAFLLPAWTYTCIATPSRYHHNQGTWNCHALSRTKPN